MGLKKKEAEKTLGRGKGTTPGPDSSGVLNVAKMFTGG